MAQSTLVHRSNGRSLVVLLISTLLIVNFLAYIDEGHYDFRWMRDPGNWAAFGLYTAVIFGLQLFCHEIILKRYSYPGKTVLAIFGGPVLLLLIILGFIGIAKLLWS